MRSAVIAVLLLAAYCEARPSFDFEARPLFGSSYIVGGEEATPGEFPWQLSQQRASGSSWSHSCGASLLSANYALSAAHCVDGAPVSILRVIAGLHNRFDNGALSNIASYKKHESYGTRSVTFSDDIAILTLATPISANGGSIQYAALPDTDDLFTGKSGIISGWGRTSSSNSLPTYLQKASTGVITADRCNQLLASVSGANVDDTQICLYDEETRRGSCNGDSGGPFNIDNGSGKIVVAGVTSWGISSWFGCLQTYPSMYTRTSAYSDWILINTL
jgi:secreted trypsin-like serine protease